MAGSNGGLIGPYNTSTATAAYGCWRPSTIAQRLNQSAFTFPTGIADPNYASVVALYQMQDFQGTASLFGVRDCVAGLYPLYQGGGSNQAGLNAFLPKWGQRSLFTLGSGFKIEGANSNAAWNFANADWCIDGWFNLISNSGSQVILDLRATTAAARIVPVIYKDASHHLNLFVNGSNRITGATTISISTWYYFAVARVSGSTRAYLGTSGTAAQEGSTYVDANTYTTPGDGATIGSDSASGSATERVSGYIGAMRVNNGSGRSFSAATIPVPTAPFPNY